VAKYQWQRYTRARHVEWRGWRIHRPGSSPGSALPSPAYCFASVIVWTESKNVTISDRFICFIFKVKRRWWPVFWVKKGRQRQKCIRLTWLEDFLTSKWPGSFTALAPPLKGSLWVMCTDNDTWTWRNKRAWIWQIDNTMRAAYSKRKKNTN